MGFVQEPPGLENQYLDDRLLAGYLHRWLPDEMRREIEPELVEMGKLSGGELYRMQLADRANEPRLISWDPWGNRIDAIEPTPLWRRAERLAAERGLVAIAYERRWGEHSRLHQFALVYLFTASTDIYSCPLAMTDGAAKTLTMEAEAELVERVVPHLTSRDPATFWTSGQWMTETTGGSDVGRSETVAHREAGGLWRLSGRKWFTSAAASQVALALARPEGNGPGGRGLALFCVETRDADGRLNGIRIQRLKDKLGTRKLPTAELELDGALATLVGAPSDGVRRIAPMLNVTRTWNAVSAISLMRRMIALARDYAHRRLAFGEPLIEHALHRETLADLQAELEGAFHLTFEIVRLLGLSEAGAASPDEEARLRLLTPVAKLLTGKQVVAVASEGLECFGGAGYVEDTGLPMLLRDAQVLPIWEGTTNVLALDALRAVRGIGGLDPLRDLFDRLVGIERGELRSLVERLTAAFGAVERWWHEVGSSGGEAAEADGRRFAIALGRAVELALMTDHAAWALETAGDRRSLAAALRAATSYAPALALDDQAGGGLSAARALATDVDPSVGD